MRIIECIFFFRWLVFLSTTYNKREYSSRRPSKQWEDNR